MTQFRNNSNKNLSVSEIFRIFAPMEAKNEYLSDREIVEGLIARNNRITHYFFWVECKKVFSYVINKLYLSHPNKEQLREDMIRDLYAELMDHDAKVLRRFNYGCKLTTWLTVVAYRHFIKIRDKELNDFSHKADLVGIEILKDSSNEDFEIRDAKKIIDRVLEAMPNQEYAYILRKRELEKCSYNQLALELNKSPNYLNNLKCKAWVMFVDTYFKIEDDYE